MQILTGRKHGQSLGTPILRFNCETKSTKTVQKLSKKFMVRPGVGAVALSPSPEYAIDNYEQNDRGSDLIAQRPPWRGYN